MSALNLRLPDSIHRHIKEIAKREGVSINLYRIAPTRTVRMWCPGLRTLLVSQCLDRIGPGRL